MKLIGMTYFVLEQEKNPMQTFAEAYRKCRAYAEFLKQPLMLGMFVPVDEEGNIIIRKSFFGYGRDYVMKTMSNKDLKEFDNYQQAKERVLFKNCVYDIVDIIANDSIYISTHNLGALTIESLVYAKLELTETAIKQIGL